MQSAPLAWILLLCCSLWRVGAADADANPAPTNDAAPPPWVRLPAGEDVIIESLTEGEVEHVFDSGFSFFRQGVVVRHGTMELVANQVALSESTGDIIANGNV